MTEREPNRAARSTASDELLEQLLEFVDETLANASPGHGAVVGEETFRDSGTFCDDDATDGDRPLFDEILGEDGESALAEVMYLTERPRGRLAVAIAAGNVIVLAVLVALLIKGITTVAILCLAVSGLFVATAALLLSLRSKHGLDAAVGEQMTLMMDSLLGDREIDFGREDELELLYRETRSDLATAIEERLERREEALRKESLREVVAVRARCEALVEKHVERVHEQNAALEAELRALRVAAEASGTKGAVDTVAAPAASDAPVASDAPMASELPVASDAPMASELPAASAAPAAGEPPSADESPRPEDAPPPAEASRGNGASPAKNRSRKKRKRNRKRS